MFLKTSRVVTAAALSTALLAPPATRACRRRSASSRSRTAASPTSSRPWLGGLDGGGALAEGLAVSVEIVPLQDSMPEFVAGLPDTMIPLLREQTGRFFSVVSPAPARRHHRRGEDARARHAGLGAGRRPRVARRLLGDALRQTTPTSSGSPTRRPHGPGRPGGAEISPPGSSRRSPPPTPTSPPAASSRASPTPRCQAQRS